MTYAEIRFTGPVKIGTRDGNFYTAGLVTIEREGDTVTLTGFGDAIDVPWAQVAYAKRAPAPVKQEPKKSAPAEEPQSRRPDRRGR